jgi:ATP synthase (C/AC39) subunit
MTAGWVAGTVRSRAMARRVLGAEAARQLAACRSLPEAQRMLQQTPFRGAGEAGLSLAAAEHAVAETILWDLRVLAGWLPRDGVSLLRLLAGWFEIANVDELLQTLAGRPSDPEFQLGGLATAWPRLSGVRSIAELRHGLAASSWGDPGGDTSRDIRLAMRVRWAARVATSGDRARAWATAAAGLLRSSEAPAGQAAESWQAETDWWRRVEADGRVLLRSSASDSDPVLGAVVVMAADARRVRAALASAARGGLALEVYDAVA